MHVLEKHTYGHLLYYQLIYPLATSFVICDVNQYNLLKLYNNYQLSGYATLLCCAYKYVCKFIKRIITQFDRSSETIIVFC